jgi:hypothetical protein
MNKLFATTALVAASLFGVQSAYAVPISPLLTMVITDASGTLAQCHTGSGGYFSSFDAGTGACTLKSSTGGITFDTNTTLSNYGNWWLNEDVGSGAGTGPFALPQPQLELDTQGRTATQGDKLTITLTASGYTSPGGPFALTSSTSGTIATSMETNVADYFDNLNTGVAGTDNPVQNPAYLFSSDWVGFASGSSPGGSQTVVVNNAKGAYSLSWVQTLIKNSDNGTVDKISTADQIIGGASVPTPTPLALLGLGLLALGGLTAKRRFDARS